MGARYLGGYIGDDISKGGCLKERTDKWERDIRALIKTADNYPQEINVAVAHTVQLEWIFLQRVKKDAGQALTGLERFLQETFLPRIFFGESKTLPPLVGSLSTLPVNIWNGLT